MKRKKKIHREKKLIRKREMREKTMRG